MDRWKERNKKKGFESVMKMQITKNKLLANKGSNGEIYLRSRIKPEGRNVCARDVLLIRVSRIKAAVRKEGKGEEESSRVLNQLPKFSPSLADLGYGTIRHHRP